MDRVTTRAISGLLQGWMEKLGAADSVTPFVLEVVPAHGRRIVDYWPSFGSRRGHGP